MPIIEEYATMPEFVALCELINQGMRFIEHSMLHLIEVTPQVRMFLETNRQVLTQIRDLIAREQDDGTKLLSLSTNLKTRSCCLNIPSLWVMHCGCAS